MFKLLVLFALVVATSGIMVPTGKEPYLSSNLGYHSYRGYSSQPISYQSFLSTVHRYVPAVRGSHLLGHGYHPATYYTFSYH